MFFSKLNMNHISIPLENLALDNYRGKNGNNGLNLATSPQNRNVCETIFNPVHYFLTNLKLLNSDSAYFCFVSDQSPKS